MGGNGSGAVKLYVVERLKVFAYPYKAIFPPGGSICLLGVSTNGDVANLPNTLSALSPDVLLMSSERLDRHLIGELNEIRSALPGMGVVILVASNEFSGRQLLRKLDMGSSAGMALFLRQSLSRIEQLFGLLAGVSEGYFILDPELTIPLFGWKPKRNLLAGLTQRELEVLDLLANGFTNCAIAKALYIDVRTVQKHINNMYYKFKERTDFVDKHPRVSAAKLYLEAIE